MAYVPPHLRNRNKENEQPDAPAKIESPRIGNRRPDSSSSTTTTSQDDGSPSLPGSAASYSGTLNASAQDPSRLTYILIFHDSNPRWKDLKVIYTKSRINLLPGCPTSEDVETELDTIIQPQDSASFVRIQRQGGSIRVQSHEISKYDPQSVTDETDADEQDVQAVTALKPLTEPIAIFEQVSAERGQQNGNFKFAGWHRVLTVTYHQPFSQGVAQMLMQKWRKTDSFGNKTEEKRGASEWFGSLKHHWADVKLVSDEEAIKELSAPKIGTASLEQQSNSGKTVNTMLAEMRLSGAGNKAGDAS
ncbi:hypothetical protein MBLNU457_5972t2 [Dothideomycetes sp. NU457]